MSISEGAGSGLPRWAVVEVEVGGGRHLAHSRERLSWSKHLHCSQDISALRSTINQHVPHCRHLARCRSE